MRFKRTNGKCDEMTGQTLRDPEIFQVHPSGKEKGSLFWHLNRTVTAGGQIAAPMVARSDFPDWKRRIVHRYARGESEPFPQEDQKSARRSTRRSFPCWLATIRQQQKAVRHLRCPRDVEHQILFLGSPLQHPFPLKTPALLRAMMAAVAAAVARARIVSPNSRP